MGSFLLPTMSLISLGLDIIFASMRTKPAPVRQDELSSLLWHTVSHRVVMVLSVMLGKQPSSHVVVPILLLYMKKIQRWFGLRLDPVWHKRWLLTILSSLTWHTGKLQLGWDVWVLCGGGKWKNLPSLHINYLELSTVIKVLKQKGGTTWQRRCTSTVRAEWVQFSWRSFLLWSHRHLLSIKQCTSWHTEPLCSLMEVTPTVSGNWVQHLFSCCGTGSVICLPHERMCNVHSGSPWMHETTLHWAVERNDPDDKPEQDFTSWAQCIQMFIGKSPVLSCLQSFIQRFFCRHAYTHTGYLYRREWHPLILGECPAADIPSFYNQNIISTLQQFPLVHIPYMVPKWQVTMT